MKPIAGVVLMSALLASGQPPVAPPPDSPRPEAMFTVTSTLVQLDAVVTDSKGHHITDLTPGDFQVFEDGKLQKLTHFSYVQATRQRDAAPNLMNEPKPAAPGPSALPPAPLAQIRPEDVRRSIVLLVDDLNLSFGDLAFVRRSLRKFVNEQVQPGDLVAICRTGGGSGILERFTVDKRVLLSAIDGLRWNILSNSTEGSLSSAGTLMAVDYIVSALRNLPGRKSVVLFSKGLVSVVGDPDAERALTRVLDRANRSGTVIYTLQTSGLVAWNRSRFADEEQQSLAYVAEETGGRAFSNGNDLNWFLDRVLEDQAGYYLLGYHPPEGTTHNKDDQLDFHRIKVIVTRAGLHVRSRSGFLGEPGDQALPTYATSGDQLRANMFSPFQSSDVDLRLTALYAEAPRHGPVVRNLLLVKGSDLTWERDSQGGGSARIVLMATATGTGDRPLETVSRAFDVLVTPEKMDEVMRDGALYVLDVPVPRRGPYQIRVAVQDRATGKTGSASQFLQIPDLKKDGFALTSVVLRDGQPSSDASGLPGVAAALRTFRRGSLLEFLSAIEKGGQSRFASDLDTRVRVLRDGKEVYSAPAHLVKLDGGVHAVAGALRLAGSITPGDYNLQVTVSDRNGGDGSALGQWTDFTVRP
ncbi:MAG: VWA domain-containing protein [Bryobacteraceae bacterium]